jgi:hypothetical protein
VRLSELVAVLSFAADFGLGQPMEHVLRACLISLRLADRLGLDPRERREMYWVTLLATVCTGESFELAQMFGNEVAFRSGGTGRFAGATGGGTAEGGADFNAGRFVMDLTGTLALPRG